VREFTQRVKRARVPRRSFLKLPVIRRVFDRARDFLLLLLLLLSFQREREGGFVRRRRLGRTLLNIINRPKKEHLSVLKGSHTSFYTIGKKKESRMRTVVPARPGDERPRDGPDEPVSLLSRARRRKAAFWGAAAAAAPKVGRHVVVFIISALLLLPLHIVVLVLLLNTLMHSIFMHSI